jgi:hypothetical protein
MPAAKRRPFSKGIGHEGGHFSLADTYFAIEADLTHREGAILHDKVQLHRIDPQEECVQVIVAACLNTAPMPW